MKKNILAGAVVLSLGVVQNASAIIVDITAMNFGSVTAVSGQISSDTVGDYFTGVFFGKQWIATTFTVYSGVGDYLWAGEAGRGSFSYEFSLLEGQYAWGLDWDWSSAYGDPWLNIMDCSDGVNCIGIATPLQVGPFPGQAPSFNGVVVSAVPIPASIWLFGGGVTGLLAFTRRRKKTRV